MQQITRKQERQQVSPQPSRGQVGAGGQGKPEGLLGGAHASSSEQQSPEAQATWLQALVGLEE